MFIARGLWKLRLVLLERHDIISSQFIWRLDHFVNTSFVNVPNLNNHLNTSYHTIAYWGIAYNSIISNIAERYFVLIDGDSSIY